MKNLIKFLLPVALLGVVEARIGETVEECEKRYGKPKVTPDHHFYKKNGYNIAISFHKGKAHSITYGKISKDKISEHEVLILLKANKSDGKWEKENGIGKTDWTNGNLSARNTRMGSKTLVILTDEWLDLLIEKSKQEETKQLQGF